MGKQVRSPPQQTDAGRLLLPLGILYHYLQSFVGFGESGTLLDEIKIVKAIIRQTQLCDKLERSVHLRFAPRNGIVADQPGQIPRR